MQNIVVVSRKTSLADDNAVAHFDDVIAAGRGPMAHQFDSVCGNQPTPQIMIQLIGCHIAASPQVDNSKLHDLTSIVLKVDWS